MKPPHLLVPKEIAQSPKEVAKYADILETCIKNGYKPDEFLSRCRDEGLNITTTEAHLDLYKELVKLDKANKNGIWARIIKNNFAPLFVGRLDYVAGNPPWVNWQSLPREYRDSMKPLWEGYGLFSLSGTAGRLGGGKKDLSMVFVYLCADDYLQTGGRLGFVITQSVFKTKGAGDGFRKFGFERKKKWTFLNPVVVHDLSEIQVFEGATNRTAVLVCAKQEKGFEYPVRYIAWSGPSSIDQDEELRAVFGKTVRNKLAAVPVDPGKPTSPWLTVPEQALAATGKMTGQSQYKAYAGCCTWLNGAFWVQVLRKLSDGCLVIMNLSDVGRIKVQRVQATIEPDLVYPLIRGRDVHRWHAIPSTHIILSQDPQTRSGILELEMKKKHPKTYAYFKKFEDQLRRRSGFQQYFRPEDPFYSVYNVGPYTLAPCKVIWKHTGIQDCMRACVTNEPDIPDQKVIFVDFRNREEAHYFCACINSSLAFWVIKNYIGLDASPHVLNCIAIPQFDERLPTHKRLAQISELCHNATAKGNTKETAALEGEIDKAAAKIWGITDDELKAIQEALVESSRSRRKAIKVEEEE